MSCKGTFLKGLETLIADDDSFRDFMRKFNLNSLTESDITKIYSELLEHLIDPKSTRKIVELFRIKILNILARNISSRRMKPTDQEDVLRNTVVLASLVKMYPDSESFVVNYFKKYPGPLNDNKLTCTAPKKKKREYEKITDFQIVEACHTLLNFKPDFFKEKWPWSEFFNRFSDSEEVRLRRHVCDCLAIYTGMNECQRQTLFAKYFRTENAINRSILDSNTVDYNPHYREGSSIEDNSDVHFSNDDVVLIGGISLPIFDKKQVKVDKSILEVESTKDNLRRVALAIASNQTVSLVGPVGCGKTCLVEYLAKKTGRVLGKSFVKVQLGDQTDSKMLLGTYRCTDVPGEFVWQAGILTQALLDGAWVLLEDIDSASMDVASVLSGLIENKCLTVTGYRDSIPITQGFHLFFTQRSIATMTGHSKKYSSALTLLEKHGLNIVIKPLTHDELVEIISTVYPSLKTIASRMVKVFSVFSKDIENIQRHNRLPSPRDLFKWCSRAIIDFHVSSQNSALKVLQDAIDIFCCSCPNDEERVALAKEISSHLGIVNDKAVYFCQQHKPNMSLSEITLKVGRGNVERKSNSVKPIRFCFTRPSANLLERIMCCVNLNEPVLLVGETGTGKTSAIQYLANKIGQKLIVINMNQQSDSADLLGGFKPVDMKFIMKPIKNEFEKVFLSYFNAEANRKFLGHINTCMNEKNWSILLQLMKKSYQAAMKRLCGGDVVVGNKRPAPKEDTKKDKKFRKVWKEIGYKLEKLEAQMKHRSAMAFSFIEGSLVKAVKNGYWVLLDEINLANAETLECLSGLLEGSKETLSLLESGDRKPIERHSDFILFACMNPSTDIGKKDLPIGLRNRFTEFYVDELTQRNDLILLVNHYLDALSLSVDKIDNIVKFYLNVRKEAQSTLCDGLGHKPHFSLRSLCRALMIASKNPCGTFGRSLYESFCLSFLTQLDANSYKTIENMIVKYLIGGAKELKSVLNKQIPEPKQGVHLQCEGYWIQKGDLEPVVPENYILTDSVKHNLKDLVRIVSIGKLPVLLQGDTSVGKTSLITYLAKISGYKCVRINNHEHTDLQEYIGSYVANDDGKLEFKEGLLVEAMRLGHWIILDELNLAPTDVLEALNRVLDDNRELYIPETQQVVKAHPNFMLFATQNPPGTYSGRKMLSRAFRNRFVELHFNEIPHNELEFILHKRCHMSPSYAKKIINVMKDLQNRRRGSAAFAGKHGFITLRDLFRWGERYRLAQNSNTLYDWDQHLADEGYLLLASRVRKTQEKWQIADAIHKHIRREVIAEHLFTLSDKTSPVTKHILEKIMLNRSKHKNIVWTYNMRQLAVLVFKSIQFKEPVLLVGETGGGKTTICELISEINGQILRSVNCHMHIESGDFIGGLRPVRDRNEDNLNKLFEWVDGPLIYAMHEGGLFLADEISLADDSVLERFNSLLEPERCLLLSEKGVNSNEAEIIVAHQNFSFVGTMNPGGDYGKKELSPALRNRFTEIWCEPCNNRQDLIDIIEHNLSVGNNTDAVGNKIMDFLEWFQLQEIGKRFTVSLRDILTWVNFINKCSSSIGFEAAYFHGAFVTFLDSLGSGITSIENTSTLQTFHKECTNFIQKQIGVLDMAEFEHGTIEMTDRVGIKPFYISYGSADPKKVDFSFDAPTTIYNVLRLLRGMQLNKAILLEGSPGVGKTSVVTALARASRNKIFRINLSDQTDISDLFGADLPVEGGQAGQFSWRDGPLLQALKQGHWVLLDELNLASQSVLEGLNACLDHRGEIFIPELGKTFYVKTGTKFFGCQNPLKQGGSRRGLPQSFLNRFTQVYLTSLNSKDLKCILTSQFPQIPDLILDNMIAFNEAVCEKVDRYELGAKGAPWEFNLRDLTRWCEATEYHKTVHGAYHPENLVKLIFVDRMRSAEDKRNMCEVFESVFKISVAGNVPIPQIYGSGAIFGDVTLARKTEGVNESVLKQGESLLILREQMPLLRSLTYCVNLNLMPILIGSAGCGKSSVVKALAKVSGKALRILSVSSEMDTNDLLGGFEQTDYTRHLEFFTKQVDLLVLTLIQDISLKAYANEHIILLQTWEAYKRLQRRKETRTMNEETELCLKRFAGLEEILKHLLKCREYSHRHQQIEHLLKHIQKSHCNFVKDGTLNAGGKFEWVDSVLVNCLKDGSWLLVDNVNLCSSAVLDRLNGLIEPNGVLTIGERGVDENGKIIEIVPHPEFRIFLTMDPKNGEISRAMRNRGIEIYILNEGEKGKRNDLDLKSLIIQQGIQGDILVEAVLEIHDFISVLSAGEQPNISHLIQTSFLIAQQLQRGVPERKAVRNAFLDVYISTKSISEFNTSDPVLLVTEKIDALLKNEKIPPHSWASVTLNTSNLESNSKRAHLLQQASIIDDDKSLSYIHFFTISSANDWSLRTSYMNCRLDPGRGYIAKHTRMKFPEDRNLPIDFRWLPDALYMSKSTSVANQLLINQYYIMRRFFEEMGGHTHRTREGDKLLDLALSAKDDIDQVLIRSFNFLEIYDNLMISLIDTQIEINNDEAIEIITLLQYRFILFDYLKCTKVEMRGPVWSNLHINYKWFIKYSIKALQRILKSSSTDDMLSRMVSYHEDDYFTDIFTGFQKLGRAYLKQLCKPPPLVNEIQLKIIPEFNNALNSSKECSADFIELAVSLKLALNYDVDAIPEDYEVFKSYKYKSCEHNANLWDLSSFFWLLKLYRYRHDYSVLEKSEIIPISLTALIQSYNKSMDARMLHELHTELNTYLRKCSALNYSKDKEETRFLTMHNSVLSHLVCNMLFNLESGDIKVTTLENFNNIGEQYKKANYAIWKNMQQLSDRDHDYVFCEVQYLKSSFNQFVVDLAKILKISSVDQEELIRACKALKIKYERVHNPPDIFSNFLQIMFTQVSQLDSSDGLYADLSAISILHYLLGYLKSWLCTKVAILDPLDKILLKKKYCLQEKEHFNDIKDSFVSQYALLYDSDAYLNPLCASIDKRILELDGYYEELKKYTAVRPSDVTYGEVAKCIRHGYDTLLYPRYVLQFFNRISELISDLQAAITTKKQIEIQRYRGAETELKTKISSHENFVAKLNNFRYTYPDIVQPLLANITELILGLNLMLSLLRKLLLSYNHVMANIDLNEMLLNVFKWPSLDEKRESMVKVVDCYLNQKVHDFVIDALKENDMDRVGKEQNFSLLKCGILEIHNACNIRSQYLLHVDKDLFHEFNKLIEKFVAAWKMQEEDIAAKKIEVENLYKMKTKCNETEEEALEREFKERFPTYHTKDFNEYIDKPLDEDELEVDNNSSEFSGLIKPEDIEFISDLHSKFVTLHTKTEWLNPVPPADSYKCEVLSPLLTKAKLFRLLLAEGAVCLDYKLDAELAGSFCVLLGLMQHSGDASCLDEDSKSKVGRFESVEEVRPCYDILDELRVRMMELLQEWPDHPTLQTINEVIQRIMNFDITSPTVRFLTGFDILLTKCHEWEENAHSGVSLAQHSLRISEQMVTWRRAEMNKWKASLDDAFAKMQSVTAKYWFYIYDIMKEFIEQKLFDTTELISTLQKFILQSNVAEFSARLSLFNVFHCHATYLTKSKERDIFINVMWNLYKYYHQFLPNIAATIKTKRAPIEKKLKDYIKIIRWKDISYWALKDTLDKTHKTIFKCIREFEEILRQPASSLLNNTIQEELVGAHDRPKRTPPKNWHYTSDANMYISNVSLKSLEKDYAVQGKSKEHFKRLRTVCLNIIERTEYPELIKKLDCFVDEIITTSKYLQGLEIDTTLPKEKQVSQSKSHLQQKQRALADLFKHLSKIGLSFRKGLLDSKCRDITEEFVIKPVDLHAAFSHLTHKKNDDKLLAIWEGVEVYYRKSFMRMDILENSLQNPAKDLGLQNVERCKGFAAHLLSFALIQKSKLIESTNIFYQLRYYETLLNEFYENENFIHVNKVDHIKKVLLNIVTSTKEYRIMLATVPDQNIPEIPTLQSIHSFITLKSDKNYENAIRAINVLQNTSEQVLSSLQKAKTTIPNVYKKLRKPNFVYIFNHDQIMKDLSLISENLQQLIGLFGNMPVGKCLRWLNEELKKDISIQATKSVKSVSDFKKELEVLNNSILICAQNLRKKYESEKVEETQEDIKDELISKLVVQNLHEDINVMNMHNLLQSIKNVTKTIFHLDYNNCKEYKEVLRSALPFLEQVIALFEYFITQEVSAYRVTCKMTSILLNIFIDLATKGFCVPSELADSMEAEGESKPTGGMGLGEGKGEKDVSDKIESEDQLEDAQPEGAEKEKQEDADCKEDEKGIEMSEDFDSKLQDVEKKPDDEENSDSDSNGDADEQMGDVEDNADQLDKEVWGSDTEDDPEKEGDDKNEQKGDKGETEGEQELGAKEGPTTQEDDKNEADKDDKNKEKSKKDVNEMDDQEYDDEQTDPYHGNQPPLPEPEPMDLPDDLQLDDDGDGEEKQEDNPFDIDAMKDDMPAPPEDIPEPPEQEAQTDPAPDCSDDEETADTSKENKEQTEEETEEAEEKPDEPASSSEDKEEPISEEIASGLDQTQSSENVEAMDIQGAEASDSIENKESQQKSNQNINEDVGQEDNPDKDGVGTSHMEESTSGHKGQANAQQLSESQEKESQNKRNRPGDTDSDRTLGDSSEPAKKRMKTIEAQEQQEREEETQKDADMYQHIKEAKESHTQVQDSVSKEQAEMVKEVPMHQDEEKGDEKAIENQDEVVEDKKEDEDVEMMPVQEQRAEHLESKNTKKTLAEAGIEAEQMDVKDVEIEGETVLTHTVPRGGETTYHTQITSDENSARLSLESMSQIRMEVEKQLSVWNEPPSNPEAEQAWKKISSLTESLARDLSEQLRLVLEPTQASHLKGDFRTGKRINMRKVIPYIASEFRKDKIWLRRTKPSKREYQIVLAIDDSSSMADNHSKELAFESVSLISKALTLLESGQLSILSFGENTEVLHKLTDTFNEKSGSKLLQKFQFDQKKTCVAKLVDFTTEMFNSAPSSSASLLAKLLIIVSDGRGIFSEGETYVQQAIRRARLSNVFIVFVIIDNPQSNTSILDIRKPIFQEGKIKEIKAYMDTFPFPFYIILRDINTLPNVLSDALRQWFELVSNVDK